MKYDHMERREGLNMYQSYTNLKNSNLIMLNFLIKSLRGCTRMNNQAFSSNINMV